MCPLRTLFWRNLLNILALNDLFVSPELYSYEETMVIWVGLAKTVHLRPSQSQCAKIILFRYNGDNYWTFLFALPVDIPPPLYDV